MAFWTAVLCALLVSILGGLYLLGAFRRRRPMEPPLDKGHIPWLGYALDFRKDSAAFLALFGNEPGTGTQSEKKAKERDLMQSEELFDEFRKYDRLFPRLAYSVLPPRDKMEAERLKRLFWKVLSVKNSRAKDNMSGWISDQEQFLAEFGVPEYMRDRFMFLLLWAAQGNTGPSSFWLLLYLMKHPEAMQA